MPGGPALGGLSAATPAAGTRSAQQTARRPAIFMWKALRRSTVSTGDRPQRRASLARKLGNLGPSLRGNPPFPTVFYCRGEAVPGGCRTNPRSEWGFVVRGGVDDSL